MINRPVVTATRSVFMTLAMLAAAGHTALAAQSDRELRTRTTPPDPDAPTEVSIYLSGIQVLQIDPQQQTFEVEGYINASWYDTRLEGPFRRLYQDEAATDILKEMWWPYFEIIDSRGPRTTIHRTVTLDFDGEVFYQERFSVQVKQDLRLDAFPFDSTDITFTVVPFVAGGDVLRFVAETDTTTTRASWEPSEWVAHVLPQVINSGEEGLPSAKAVIAVSRVPDSYLQGIIFPLALIVVISSAVFWMNLESTHLGDRLGVSFTALLTVVAFDFVTSDSLPNLWYLTIMDRILIGTYVVMALVMVQNVVACVVHNRNKPRLALGVDRVSRALFPVGYIVFVMAQIAG